MADTVREPPVVWRKRAIPKPAYHESGYKRPILKRLTPFTWFVIALGVLAVVAAAILISNSIAARAHSISIPLPDRLAQLQQADTKVAAVASAMPSPPPVKRTVTNKAALPAAPGATPTASPMPTPTSAPTPTPTPNPNDAPWAKHMVQQPDGTFLAPAGVDKAVADLGAYYTHQQNLTLDQFLRERYDLLSVYFTGQALAQLRQRESARTQYAMNRSGTVIIEIRNFSPDGNSAVAGVTRKGWVDDVYDVSSRKLIQQGVSEPDSLSVMSIVFDHATGRWKFATLDPDNEVQQ